MGRVADVLQDGQQHAEVVPVDRADVVEAELLEQRAAGPIGARHFLGERGAAFPILGQALGELLQRFAEVEVGAARRDAREIGRECADRGRDRHVVVVEDDDEALVAGAGVVHGLVGHARTHGAVADDADDVVGAAVEIAGDRHAEAGGDRGRGVRGAEGVVLALGALGKAGEAAALAQRADAVAPPGQDFVRDRLGVRRPRSGGRPGCRRRSGGRRSARPRRARRRDGRRSPRPRRSSRDAIRPRSGEGPSPARREVRPACGPCPGGASCSRNRASRFQTGNGCGLRTRATPSSVTQVTASARIIIPFYAFGRRERRRQRSQLPIVWLSPGARARYASRRRPCSRSERSDPRRQEHADDAHLAVGRSGACTRASGGPWIRAEASRPGRYRCRAWRSRPASVPPAVPHDRPARNPCRDSIRSGTSRAPLRAPPTSTKEVQVRV